MINLLLPYTLSLGSRPLSQVAAAYHYTITQGSYTQAKYCSEWGWTEIETRIFLEQIISWHNNCNISNISNISNINIINTTTTNNTNTNNYNYNISGGGEKNIKTIIINQREFIVDSEVTEQLFTYIKSSKDCQDLIWYWVELYESINDSVDTLLAKDLGTISAVVRQGHSDKAQRIFDWVFESDHRRAVYLRSQGFMFPHVLISRAKLPENFELAKQHTKQPVTTKPTYEIPEFDKDGNLVEKF